jgi:hypothetical protein
MQNKGCLPKWKLYYQKDFCYNNNGFLRSKGQLLAGLVVKPGSILSTEKSP